MNTPRKYSFIRIHEQRSGLQLEFVRVIDWQVRPIEHEFILKALLNCNDIDDQVKKCREALEQENGIFFIYPDFAVGAQRSARILEANKVYPIEDCPMLELIFVVNQDGFDDIMQRNSPE